MNLCGPRPAKDRKTAEVMADKHLLPCQGMQGPARDTGVNAGARLALILRAVEPENRVIKIGNLLGGEGFGGGSDKNKVFLQQLLQPRQMFNASSHGNPPGQVGHLALALLRQEPVIKKDRRMRVRGLTSGQQIGLRQ